MIPYQELCDALAQWRSRNGLTNGPSARMPTGPINTLVSVPPDEGATPPQGEATMAEDSPLPGQPTTISRPPATFVVAEDSLDGDAPTGLHVAPDKRETTNEIDDSDLIDEDDL